MKDADTPKPSADLARLRLVLTRELETISTYEALARETSTDELRTFFLNLAQEEKEHVAEATLLLRRFDDGQDAFFQKNYSQEHFAGNAPHPAVTANERPPAAAFTVGPLKRRKV